MHNTIYSKGNTIWIKTQPKKKILTSKASSLLEKNKNTRLT